MKATLYKEKDKEIEYICDILDIPISGGYKEEFLAGRQIVSRLFSHFITNKGIDFGMGKDSYLVYVAGLGYFRVTVSMVTPQKNGSFKCDYVTYLRADA